ncbi:hypothetical protein PHMEG_00029367 [Phytophthora megakarya]|uniref:HAT C-terminal dimerisation domain-containing protein n=1 Tax=Phytophthora megakarya TaxID=4795 RepID=A0A225V189_9STRA|nr:hypothetical protein PHMEG_00029367 [Phytophthora megakarya]
MKTCSYAFEVQLLLHPNFKNPDGALKKVIQRTNLQAEASQQVADHHSSQVVFSEDIMELFAETVDEVVPPPAETRIAMHTQRVDEELDRWLMTPSALQAVLPRELEPIISYWKRQQEQGTFRLLPLVARVLSLAPYNVDMATFLNCNRSYVDITQCPKLSLNSAEERLPSSVLVNMVQDLDDEFGSLANLFSSESMNLGFSDNEDAGEE